MTRLYYDWLAQPIVLEICGICEFILFPKSSVKDNRNYCPLSLVYHFHKDGRSPSHGGNQERRDSCMQIDNRDENRDETIHRQCNRIDVRYGLLVPDDL
jgi:hypothetical protein